MPTLKPLAIGVNLALVLMALTSQPAAAQVPAATRSPQELAAQELIRSQITPEYLETVYVEAAGQASIQFQASIQPTLARAMSENEKQRLYAFWYRKVREMIPYAAMEQMLVPVYVRYFTLEELEEINQFYQTPVGRKMSELSPTLFQEGSNAGQELTRNFVANEEWMNATLTELRSEFPSWFPE